MSDDIQNTNRLSYVDIGAGIMIIWLLYYHALYPMYEREILNVFPWLFYFMPWFFYKSGYFFKPKSLKESAKKDAAKLLKQFAIWSAIGYIVYIISMLFITDDFTLRNAFYRPMRSFILSGTIPLNSALWFLPVLFFVRIIGSWTYKKCKVGIIGMISGLFAIIVHLIDIPYMPGYIYCTAWGLFFFSSGYMFKKHEQNKWLLSASLIMLILTFIFTDIPEVYKKDDTIEWYWYILWYPASIAGCIVFNNVCRWLEKVETRLHTYIHTSLFSLIKWVGRHSMTFYVAHYIIFKVVFDLLAIYHESWYDSWQGLLVITVAYIGIIVPLCYMIDKIQKGYAK